jgi:hypothetical protein
MEEEPHSVSIKWTLDWLSLNQLVTQQTCQKSLRSQYINGSFGVFLKNEITYLAVVFHCASCSDGRWAVDWAVDLPCAFVDVG